MGPRFKVPVYRRELLILEKVIDKQPETVLVMSPTYQEARLSAINFANLAGEVGLVYKIHQQQNNVEVTNPVTNRTTKLMFRHPDRERLMGLDRNIEVFDAHFLPKSLRHRWG